MLMVAGLLALTIAAVFSGAATYVLAVEHVAREALDDRGALTEWKPSYKRGAIMQASIALVATVLRALAWWQTHELWFAVGAILMLLPWPWTLLFIKPTNDKLLATSLDAAGPQTRAMLKAWGRYHAVRAALGCAATVAYFVALLG
jgi:hypothetical protein